MNSEMYSGDLRFSLTKEEKACRKEGISTKEESRKKSATHRVDRFLKLLVTRERLLQEDVEFVLKVENVLHPPERRLRLRINRSRCFRLLLPRRGGVVLLLLPLALPVRVRSSVISADSDVQPFIDLLSDLDDPPADPLLQRLMSLPNPPKQRIQELEVLNS
jgi:hypothetical protein